MILNSSLFLHAAVWLGKVSVFMRSCCSSTKYQSRIMSEESICHVILLTCILLPVYIKSWFHRANSLWAYSLSIFLYRCNNGGELISSLQARYPIYTRFSTPESLQERAEWVDSVDENGQSLTSQISHPLYDTLYSQTDIYPKQLSFSKNLANDYWSSTLFMKLKEEDMMKTVDHELDQNSWNFTHRLSSVHCSDDPFHQQHSPSKLSSSSHELEMLNWRMHVLPLNFGRLILYGLMQFWQILVGNSCVCVFVRYLNFVEKRKSS